VLLQALDDRPMLTLGCDCAQVDFESMWWQELGRCTGGLAARRKMKGGHGEPWGWGVGGWGLEVGGGVRRLAEGGREWRVKKRASALWTDARRLTCALKHTRLVEDGDGRGVCGAHTQCGGRGRRRLGAAAAEAMAGAARILCAHWNEQRNPLHVSGPEPG